MCCVVNKLIDRRQGVEDEKKIEEFPKGFLELVPRFRRSSESAKYLTLQIQRCLEQLALFCCFVTSFSKTILKSFYNFYTAQLGKQRAN